MTLSRALLALVLSYAAAGCFESSVTVGDDSMDASIDALGGAGGTCGWPVAVGCGEGEPLSPPVTWDGWMEGASFGVSGSDRVRLEIHEDGSGGHEGFLLVGEAPPLPAPTSACSCDWAACFIGRSPHSVSPSTLWDGYLYTIRDVTLTANRLQFRVNTPDPWGAYCSMLEPVTFGGEPSCLGRAAGTDEMSCWTSTAGTEDAVRYPIDCCRFSACALSAACECDATGCRVKDWGMEIDLLIDGDVASGSSIHLVRVP